MRNWRNLINPYRLAWLAAVLLFALAIYWVLFLRPRDPASMRVKPEEVQSPVVDQGNPPEQQAGERPEPFRVDVSGASLTLTSRDGKLSMRVWADEAFKHGAEYSIKEGALQFVLENRDTMLVRVTDASMSTVYNVATVSGTLVGQLVEGGQYFSARKLVWKQDSATVQVSEVRYVGPSVEVSGHTMDIDLASGEVRFAGPVEAGI